MNRGHHSAIQFVTGLVHAGRVDQDNLSMSAGDDAENFETSRLRLVGDRGDLLADQSIQQSRFAGVGAADESHIAGVE